MHEAGERWEDNIRGRSCLQDVDCVCSLIIYDLVDNVHEQMNQKGEGRAAQPRRGR